MTVFILYENDFGHWNVIEVFDSLDKARVRHAEKESENTRDWITYNIEAWDVK